MDQKVDVAPIAAQSSIAGTTHSQVTANLTFIVRPTRKPVFQSAACTHGEPRLFFSIEQRAVIIRDLRQLAPAPRLDGQGFELRMQASKVGDFYDDVEIARVYYPEVRTLVAAALGASRVVVFDVTRRSDAGTGARNRDGLRGPARRVHVDYTTRSGPERTREVLGTEEANGLLQRGTRVVQVNVWRPIRGPVQRAPLALADAGSVRGEDLVATDQIFPNRVGEIYHLAYNPTQRWYYAPLMRVDEVVLIKGWDSLADGRARFTPHGAFDLPGTTAATPTRESIEVRTLAIIEP